MRKNNKVGELVLRYGEVVNNLDREQASSSSWKDPYVSATPPPPFLFKVNFKEQSRVCGRATGSHGAVGRRPQARPYFTTYIVVEAIPAKTFLHFPLAEYEKRNPLPFFFTFFRLGRQTKKIVFDGLLLPRISIKKNVNFRKQFLTF